VAVQTGNRAAAVGAGVRSDGACMVASAT
jgi:hypothetical protein